MTECPICKSNNIIKLTNDSKAYGLVEIIAPDKVNLNNLLPVYAYCCKDCGHIELKHVDPNAIQK